MLALSIAMASFCAVPQQGVAQDVARLLQERCSSCHSLESDDPKARRKWSDAGDLAATAINPKLVVPGDPDESELFAVIDFEDMPPGDSDVEPLNEAEKELLAEWIRAGAVVPEPVVAEPAETTPEQLTEEGGKHEHEAEESNALTVWISHFHPLAIHFPIALLTAAFLAELFARVRPAWKSDGEAAARFCLALGALSALPSAFLGWMLAENLSHTGSDVELHRWLGSSTAIGAILVWWACRRWPTRRLLLLALLAAIVGATGHTGGALSYGADWLELPF